MPFARRSSLAILALILPAAPSLVPSLLAAQAVQPGPHNCFRPKPLPACRTFWVVEGGYYHPIVGTKPEQSDRLLLGYHVAGEMGWMRNSGGGAHGLVIEAGVSKPGSRYGLLFRERRWLGETGSLDVSAGIVKAGVRSQTIMQGKREASGVTADVALGVQDLAIISLRGDFVRSDDGRANALYGGVRLGSRALLPVSITGAVILLAAVVALSL